MHHDQCKYLLKKTNENQFMHFKSHLQKSCCNTNRSHLSEHSEMRQCDETWAGYTSYLGLPYLTTPRTHQTRVKLHRRRARQTMTETPNFMSTSNISPISNTGTITTNHGTSEANTKNFKPEKKAT